MSTSPMNKTMKSIRTAKTSGDSLEKLNRRPSTQLLEKDFHLRVQALYYDVYNASAQMLSSSQKNEFLTKKSVNKMKEPKAKFIAHIHQEVMRRLGNLGSELKEDVYVIPQALAGEVERIYDSMSLNELEELYQDNLSAELDFITVKDLLEKINKNLQTVAKYDQAIELAKLQIEKRYKSCFSDKNNLYPQENKLAQMRKDILDLFCLESTELKELVLNHYIDLCEADPITRTSSDNLVNCLSTLLKWYTEGLFYQMNDTLLSLTVKSFALTLECLLLHMSQHLSAQRKEIRENAIKMSEAIESINIHDDEGVTFWANYAKFASILIQTEDGSINNKIFEGAIRVIRVGIKLGVVIASPSPDSIQTLIEETLTDITDLYNQIHWGADWFNDALALKKTTRIAIYNYQLFSRIIPTFRNCLIEKKGTLNLKNLFFSYLKNLETAILRSPDERVKWESLKLLIHFFYVDNSTVQKRAIDTLLLILEKATLKIKNSTQILLEFISNTNPSFKDQLKSILDKKTNNLSQISSKSKYYPQATNYFLQRSLQIRQFEDNAGLSDLLLLAYTNEPIAPYLEVFAKVPALTKDHHDYKSNTIYHLAAQIPNNSAINSLLKSPLTLPWDSPNQNGERPSHIAVSTGNIALLNTLLQKGINLKAVNNNQETLIHLAVRAQSEELLNLLCGQNTIDINALNYDSKSALNLAIELDYIEGMTILETYGGTIAESRFHITPLMVACRQRNLKVVTHYLNKKNVTLLEMAEIIHMLSKDRNNVNVSTNFVYVFFNKISTDPEFNKIFLQFLSVPHPRIILDENNQSSTKSQLELFQTLQSLANNPGVFELKIDVDKQTIPEIIQLIKQEKFDLVNIADYKATDSLKCTPLMYLAGVKSMPGLSLAKKLLDNQADPLEQNILKTNAVISAFAHQNHDFIDLLAKRGVSLESECVQGFRPAHIAAITRQYSLLRLLFEKSVDFKCQTQYLSTPLHLFCGVDRKLLPTIISLSPVNPIDLLPQSNTSSIVSVNEPSPSQDENIAQDLTILDRLLERSDPFAQDALGCTCLHNATLYGEPHIIEHLLEKYPQLFWVANNQGILPIQILLNKKIRARDQKKINAFNKVELNFDNSIASSTGQSFAHLAASAKLYKQLSDIYTKDPLALDKRNPMTQQSPLHEAAKVGFIEIFTLVQLKKNTTEAASKWVEQTDLQGYTPFHLAAIYNQKEFMESYLKYYPKAHLKMNNDGRQAVHLAASKGNQEALTFLIEHKIALEQTDNNGDTPMHLAARSGHLNIIQMFDQQNASLVLIKNDDGLTPFHISCIKGHLPSVCYFLYRGLEIPNNENEQIKNILTKNNWYESIPKKIVLDKERVINPDLPNDSGLTGLYLAASKGHKEVVRALILSGGSPYQVGDIGETAAHVASFRGYYSIVKDLLVSSKARLDNEINGPLAAQIDAQGETPLHEASKLNQSDANEISRRKEIIYQLLKYGSPPNHGDEKGLSALHVMMRDGSLELGKQLFSASRQIYRDKNRQPKFLVYIEPVDHQKNTPLHFAATGGHNDCIQFLLSSTTFKLSKEHHQQPFRIKAHVDPVNNEGATPLWLAVKQGWLSTVQLLRAYRANMRIHNNQNQTLFHLIYGQPLTNDHHVILNLLFKDYPYGIYQQDDSGNTPLHLIAKRASEEDAKELLKKLPGTETEKLSFLKKRNKDGLTASEINNGAIHSALSNFNRDDLGIDSTLARTRLEVLFDRMSLYRATASSSSSSRSHQATPPSLEE